MRAAWVLAVVTPGLALGACGESSGTSPTRSRTSGSDRRSEAEAANKAFTTSVQGIAGQLGSSLSASDAKAGVLTALQQPEASYEKTFAPLNCD